MFRKHLATSAIVLAVFTFICGVFYPLAVTAIAQVVFPRQANGSLIVKNGTVRGSSLIGQPFSDPKYFWGRLSATSPFPYNAASSSGSNYGPLNPSLADAVAKRVRALKEADPSNGSPIPVDLVTSSASGLDPDISIAAALYQAQRVARARGLKADVVRKLIESNTTGRQLGFLGEPRVNVLNLNLNLDLHKEGQ